MDENVHGGQSKNEQIVGHSDGIERGKDAELTQGCPLGAREHGAWCMGKGNTQGTDYRY